MPGRCDTPTPIHATFSSSSSSFSPRRFSLVKPLLFFPRLCDVADGSRPAPCAQAIPGPPLKVQEIVSRPHPLSPVQVGTILSTINFGILSGLDPNTNNVVVAAKYTVAVGFNPLVMCR